MVYIPVSFEEKDKGKLYDFIQQHSFGMLVTQHEGRPFATSIPFHLDREQGCLYGHVARANPQWQDVEGDVLVIFQGPHAYISPTWYETSQSVPTWNYVAVHAYGKWTPIEDQEELLRTLGDATQDYEVQGSGWSLEAAGPAYIEGLSKAIVGFKIQITELEGKWKLSQNHSMERRQRVIEALKRQPDAASRQIAELMRETLVRPTAQRVTQNKEGDG